VLVLMLDFVAGFAGVVSNDIGYY